MTDKPLPGRKLDEAIAKLLGWRYSKLYGWLDAEGQQTLKPLTSISTDDATAIATLQQLCKPVEEGGRGWVVYIELWLSCTEVWIEGHEAVQNTFAHAAVLAMLAALEAEK